MVRINKTQYAEPDILASDGTKRTALIILIFASPTATEMTNQPVAITEWDAVSVNRAKVDMRHFTQYKVVITLTVVNAGANCLWGVEYSLDNSQFTNLTDGVDDTIPPVNAGSCTCTAAAGVIDGGWTNITDAAKVEDCWLAAFGTCDVNTGDPSISKIEVHLR